jgi:hypothetical protein
MRTHPDVLSLRYEAAKQWDIGGFPRLIGGKKVPVGSPTIRYCTQAIATGARATTAKAKTNRGFIQTRKRRSGG